MRAQAQVLVIDDDAAEIFAVRKAFEMLRLDYSIRAVRDGKEGLAALRGQGLPPVEQPFVILLDLDLPDGSGPDFLRQLREDAGLRQSIVFALSTAEARKGAAYDHNVAGVLVRGRETSYIQLASLLDSYCRNVALP